MRINLVVGFGLGQSKQTKVEDFPNNLSVCYRCDAAIEPLTSDQWFVAVDKKIPGRNNTLKQLATQAVKSGEINILPDMFKTFRRRVSRELKFKGF